MAKAPPIIDFSGFYENNIESKQDIANQVRAACLDKGFFQITHHRIPPQLQDAVFEYLQKFFALPLEEKQKLDKAHNTYNRGYEMLRSQIFEEDGKPDLKEGFYLGRDLPPEHPSVRARKFNCGPNLYPSNEMMSEEDANAFRDVMDTYFDAAYELAKDVLKVLALTLDVDENWFVEYAEDAVAIIRLLHYPAQPVGSDVLEKGIGAHNDFGGITLLMQGDVPGLEVWDRETDTWIGVEPVRGAYVVNLGNLMMRWSNDRYHSNLHRVINTSGRERYSVPFFFNGNPDFLITTLPNCGEEAKYEPITVAKWVGRMYAESYGRAERYKKKLLDERERTSAAGWGSWQGSVL